MERVWLHTSYYLDPAVLDLSEGAEVLFTRCIAYCGNAETSGIVTETALKLVAVRALNRRKNELISAGLLVEISTGVYRLKGWDRWQKKGDELAQRRRSDRERKRKQRERELGQSRDNSRDVTPTEIEIEIEKGTNHVPEASHVSNVRHETERPDDRPTGPAIKPDAARMVREIIPRNQPDAVKSALRIKASEMLVAGTDPDIVRAALHEWMSRTDVGPGILPSLVSGLLKAQEPRAAPKRALTKSERQFVDLELMKDTPDPAALRQLGIELPTTNLRAINGGAQ